MIRTTPISVSRLTSLARWGRARGDLVLLAGAVALSQAAPQPARVVAEHHGLDVALAVLVFATAVAIPSAAFRSLVTNSRRLAVCMAASATVLPVLSWGVSRMVAPLALRRGVLTVGLAPAEIASVAATSLAGGDGAVAAGILVASTLFTVAGAGVGLRLLGGGGTIRLLPLLINLDLVVGAPLAAGIAIGICADVADRERAVAARISVVVVTVLVWLVASQVRWSRSYVAVTIALVMFVAGSAVLGAVLGLGSPRPVGTALLLTTSMRDFAVAAGIAVAAFGPSASAPLGIYGVIVIAWGMTVATWQAHRQAAGPRV